MRNLASTNFDPALRGVRARAEDQRAKGVFGFHEKSPMTGGVSSSPCVRRSGPATRGPQGGSRRARGGQRSRGSLSMSSLRKCRARQGIATDVVPFEGQPREGRVRIWSSTPRDDVPSKVKAANGGRYADLVVTCTGAPSGIVQGMQSVDRVGRSSSSLPSSQPRRSRSLQRPVAGGGSDDLVVRRLRPTTSERRSNSFRSRRVEVVL